MEFFADLHFGGIFISEKKKKKKKSVSSDVALCVFSMQVLHCDFQVIQDDFQLFSTSHFSCVLVNTNQFFYHLIARQNRYVYLLCFSFLSRCVNQLLNIPAILTITVNVYLLLFNPTEPVYS